MRRQEAEVVFTTNNHYLSESHEKDFNSLVSRIDELIDRAVNENPNLNCILDIKKFEIEIDIRWFSWYKKLEDFQYFADETCSFNLHENYTSLFSNPFLKKKLIKIFESRGWDMEIPFLNKEQIKIVLSYPSNLIWFNIKNFFSGLWS